MTATTTQRTALAGFSRLPPWLYGWLILLAVIAAIAATHHH